MDFGPRTKNQRSADALRALGAGLIVLRCQCGAPDCPAAQRRQAVAIDVLAEQTTVNSDSQAERALRLTKTALRSATESLAKSADSQDRAAKALEEAANHSDPHREQFREQAARHREFAREGRRMAQRMRQHGRQ